MISLLKLFENRRVLILGDVMVDSYVWGKVSRISPEAPVPVVIHEETENRPGGAANVALNIKSLGAIPVMCSVIGNDVNGNIFREMIKSLGMPDEGLITAEDRITTNKTRIVAGHQQLLRVDREVEHSISKESEEKLWERTASLISRGDIAAIIFQDYDKGVITRSLIDLTIAAAKKQGIPTLVDPKKRNFSHYHDATLFKPNFKELMEGLNLDIKKSDFTSVHEAAQTLQKRSRFGMVMVTLSEQGMLLSMDDGYKTVPTHAREVADVSGAGDTVIAMASLCLSAGLDPYSMARLSNLAAGLVIERIGVVPVEKEWLADTAFDW